MFDDKHLPSKGQALLAQQLQFRLFVSFFLKGYVCAF